VTQGLSMTAPARTLSGSKSTTFTLVLGGKSGSSNIPSINIAVKQVCVTFE
jgi:hypothetical protein